MFKIRRKRGTNFLQAGTGASVRTVQNKLRETFSVTDFGAVLDGTTDDSAAVQAAIDALQANSLVAITGTAGSEIVGGGRIYFPPGATGCKISSQVNITCSKIVFEGAKFIFAGGITGFSFDYSGSHYKSWVVFKNCDFSGGAIHVDVGTNIVPMPAHFENCKFINATTAGIKIGSNGFAGTVRDCLFTGCANGVWHQGSASDGWVFDHNVFIYNSSYDILIENTNVFKIIYNEFVGNLKSPASGAANIKIALGSNDQATGGYSIIAGNKFGQESRSDGNCILITGTNAAALVACQITDNLLHFAGGTTGKYAIKVDGVEFYGCTVKDNSILYCSLIDSSTMTTGILQGQNVIGPNLFYDSTAGPASDLIRANSIRIELDERESSNVNPRINLLSWGHVVNDGSVFTLTDMTPSYLSDTDENGIASIASNFTSTSSSNALRIAFPTNFALNTKYTFSIWLKLDAAGYVTFKCFRVTDYALSRTIQVGTTFQRYTFEMYENVYNNSYVMDITIPNGAVLTTGAMTLVQGRDVGDLWAEKTNVVKQFTGTHYTCGDIPTVGYFKAGAMAWKNAPVEAGGGGSKYIIHGWRRLTTGTGHVLNTDWFEVRALTGN